MRLIKAAETPQDCRVVVGTMRVVWRAHLIIKSALIVSLATGLAARANPTTQAGGNDGQSSPAVSQAEAFEQYLNQLRQQDKCGTIYTSKAHGYDVRDYLVRTSDKYELHLHRLIHPEDFNGAAAAAPAHGGAPQVPGKPKKKPYLLVHGLIGSSAGFVTNVDDFYRAPPQSYRAFEELAGVLEARAQDYQYEWHSTAESQQSCSIHERVQRDKFAKKTRQFAESLELQFDGGHMQFGRDFRQAYKKFRLPQASLGYTTNSLAFTLANFGYDVWMLNLRGNHYSRGFNGPLNANRAEFWDFNIETLIKEDLAASIRFVQRETQLADEQQLGLVTYSYSAAHVMGLLTKFPKYQQQLRPIVMLAPTLLTGTSERGKFKYFMKLANGLISRNGPFPVWGRGGQNDGGGGSGGAALSGTAKSSSKPKLLSLPNLHNLDHKLERLVCSLPVASKLCRLLETIIHGQVDRVASVRGLLTSDRSGALMQRDIDCGQTSKAVLHQIIGNLSQENIHPNYMPFAPGKQSSMVVAGRQQPTRPALMILHAESDAISTPAEVCKIRDTALKTLTLVDYLIKEPDFSHTDFLFSQRNQYLVNAEVVRMALVHDYLSSSAAAADRASLRGPPPSHNNPPAMATAIARSY